MNRSEAPNLTLEEIDVLNVLAEGDSTREISAYLGISPLETRKYLREIYSKLGARNAPNAIYKAYKKGLILTDEQTVTFP